MVKKTVDKDYYEIMGVDPNVSMRKIKSRYRKLALEYHPDRLSDQDKTTAETMFKDIAEAYHVLGNPRRRRQYNVHLKELNAKQSLPEKSPAQFTGYLKKSIKFLKEDMRNSALWAQDNQSNIIAVMMCLLNLILLYHLISMKIGDNPDEIMLYRTVFLQFATVPVLALFLILFGSGIIHRLLGQSMLKFGFIFTLAGWIIMVSWMIGCIYLFTILN